VRWSTSRWVVPAAVFIPVTLVWYLSAAVGAGTPVAETLGASGPGVGALLAAVLSPSLPAGHPIVRHAALVTLVCATLLVLGALGVAALRARTYGRLEGAVLLLLVAAEVERAVNPPRLSVRGRQVGSVDPYPEKLYIDQVINVR